MRYIILISISISFLSCGKDEIITTEKCRLSQRNPIKNLKLDGQVGPDSLYLNLEGSLYKFEGLAASITNRFYDFKLDSRTGDLKTADGSLLAFVSFYYPGDSSYFNNQNYLGKFSVKDGDVPHDLEQDSLAFASQCAFNLHLEIITESGQRLKSIERSNPNSNFFQIDSIKYIQRELFEYAQYRIFGNFEAVLTDDESSIKRQVSGRLTMQFETEKQ